MKITCLTENTCNKPHLAAEHGLSLFIETKGKNILFDMGQTDIFAKNASMLNIDLTKTDYAILSHGHYDHGGGMKTFFEINSTAPIFINPYAFEPHFNNDGKYIGLDTSLEKKQRFVFTDDIFSIESGLTIFSCNKNKKKHNMQTMGMTVTREGKNHADDFRHEQYLLIEEEGKNILISGCSHKGILDITEWFTPDVLIGGFHFSKLPLDDKLTSYAKKLNSFDTVYYTCHCTGREQYDFMKPHIKNLNYLSVGDTICL